jgi:hypothetical protein
MKKITALLVYLALIKKNVVIGCGGVDDPFTCERKCNSGTELELAKYENTNDCNSDSSSSDDDCDDYADDCVLLCDENKSAGIASSYAYHCC